MGVLWVSVKLRLAQRMRCPWTPVGPVLTAPHRDRTQGPANRTAGRVGRWVVAVLDLALALRHDQAAGGDDGPRAVEPCWLRRQRGVMPPPKARTPSAHPGTHHRDLGPARLARRRTIRARVNSISATAYATSQPTSRAHWSQGETLRGTRTSGFTPLDTILRIQLPSEPIGKLSDGPS